jgi:hypothetical protein
MGLGSLKSRLWTRHESAGSLRGQLQGSRPQERSKREKRRQPPLDTDGSQRGCPFRFAQVRGEKLVRSLWLCVISYWIRAVRDPRSGFIPQGRRLSWLKAGSVRYGAPPRMGKGPSFLRAMKALHSTARLQVLLETELLEWLCFPPHRAVWWSAS